MDAKNQNEPTPHRPNTIKIQIFFPCCEHISDQKKKFQNFLKNLIWQKTIYFSIILFFCQEFFFLFIIVIFGIIFSKSDWASY